MENYELAQIEAALFVACVKAIEEVGMDIFKATSLFGSNDSGVLALAA